MKILSILLITFILSPLSFAQEKTKRVAIQHNNNHELIRVLKSDKTTKHGEYKRLTQVSNLLLENGEYDHDERIGDWKFYYRTNKKPELEQIYNFSSDSLIFSCNKTGSYETAFGPQDQGSIEYTPAVHIGGLEHLHNIIIDEIDNIIKEGKISKSELIASRPSGDVVISFTVDKDGSVKDPQIEVGFSTLCNKLTMDAFNATYSKWIPATRNGEKVQSRTSIGIRYKYDEAYDSKNVLKSFVLIDRTGAPGGYSRRIT